MVEIPLGEQVERGPEGQRRRDEQCGMVVRERSPAALELVGHRAVGAGNPVERFVPGLRQGAATYRSCSLGGVVEDEVQYKGDAICTAEAERRALA
jgi:hypothetical protein